MKTKEVVDELTVKRAITRITYEIIERKGATYYGIGMAMVRITRAILGDDHSVLTVSSMLHGEYGERDVYAGTPCIVSRDGVKRTVELTLTPEEREKLHDSCELLRSVYRDIRGV